jgi:hypothetical protein
VRVGIPVGEAGYGCGGEQYNGCEYEEEFLHGVSPFGNKSFSGTLHNAARSWTGTVRSTGFRKE